jgi:hypothetical protein
MQLAFHPATHTPTHPHPGATALRVRSGMGATDQQITALFGSIGTMIPVAGPFIAAAASIAIAIETLFAGCGQTCVQTSNAANQVATLLDQNLKAYMAQPVHYYSIQQAALTVSQNAWAQLQATCGNPQFGAAGQRCISDRQSGACTWKSSPWGWTQGSDGSWTFVFSGPNGSGSQCWNWVDYYISGIANDPTVVADPVAATDTATTGTNAADTSAASSTSSLSSILPLVVIAGIAFFLMEEM